MMLSMVRHTSVWWWYICTYAGCDAITRATQDITEARVGTYTMAVMDASGCIAQKSIVNSHRAYFTCNTFPYRNNGIVENNTPWNEYQGRFVNFTNFLSLPIIHCNWRWLLR
ncbi:MAG: hypothetical protein IPP29_20765 [Bacteroidetes bacterium]|nr:hypothetical protein [Bacteroidota bacterium]